jgi:DNA-binding transcriptional LysR family regulator
MDIALFEAFVRVNDIGSISRAANSLGCSQPGLSQRIQTLERRLDLTLFRRIPTGVTLTDSGRVVLPYARMILRVADALHAAADHQPGQESSSLAPGSEADDPPSTGRRRPRRRRAVGLGPRRATGRVLWSRVIPVEWSS